MTKICRPPSRFGHLCSLVLVTTGCGGEEFSSAAPASSGGGGGNVPSGGGGGSAGGAPGGGGKAGASGAPAQGGGAGQGGSASQAGGAGQGGGAGAGSGGAPAVAPCGPATGKSPKLYTTLDSAPEILKPTSGIGPGAGNGTFIAGKCAAALSISDVGHYLTYPALGNIGTTRGTLDLWMLPQHDPSDGKPHTLAYVPGRLNIAKNDVGMFAVGIADAAAGTQVTLVAAAAVPYVKGAWTRVTVTWNFDVGGQNVHVYFDAVEVTSYATASSGVRQMQAVDGDDPLVIGARSNGSVEIAAAVLDDVKLYDSVVTPK